MISRCANCGVPDGDDVKLKDCSACHLVKYCGVKCQKEHRPKHKRECKKRVAELKDEILFKQPESSHMGDCPICFLPLPLYESHTTTLTCCVQVVCNGCYVANKMRELEAGTEHCCPFCRKVLSGSDEEREKRLEERAAMNDSVAMRVIGKNCLREGDDRKAFEYLSKAALLGDVIAHNSLAIMYKEGKGVEMDMSKVEFHLEKAAIGGHHVARHNLGAMEFSKGCHDRAIKHCIIASKLGHDESLAALKRAYTAGYVNKDDFAAALRGHQAAVNATKSSQRDEAEEFFQKHPIF